MTGQTSKRALIAMRVERSGYDVITASNGRECIEKAQSENPDLIVLDLHIPNISGDVVLKHARADERLKDTRVFLATADANMASQLRDQAELVLLKPIGFSQLRDLAERFRPVGND